MYKYIVFSFETQLEVPNIAFLNISNLGDIPKEEVLYIGRDSKDRDMAETVGVDFGLALWEYDSSKHIYAKYYFNSEDDILYILNRNEYPFKELPWLKWAMELQFIAQAGITYSKDPFDLERFQRLRDISAEIVNLKSGIDIDQVKNIFCNETGFQTPKLDTRAAIFKEGKILLVKEKDGTWSLPGGWVDVNQTIRSNTIKEVKEEAGLDVFPSRLIAVQDRNMHNTPVFAYGVCKVFVLCEIIDGEFTENIETSESSFFSFDKLPPLSVDRNTLSQIELCFKAYKDPQWKVVFD